MSSNIGGLPPWATWGPNFPGSRVRLDGYNATRQRAAGVAVPGVGWERFGLGVVRSPLDGVRVVRRANAVDDDKGAANNGAINVSPI